MQLPIFKIRPSQAHKIMGNLEGITEKQLMRINELTVKPKLTALQSEELAKLIAKRDAPPQLSQGAKTYCQEWVKEQIYGCYRDFSNNQTRKGEICEQEGIDMVCDILGKPRTKKNEFRLQNDWCDGEADLVLDDSVEDIKNSYDPYSFPLFEDIIPDAGYIDQIQCYMELYGKTKGGVNYVLIDMPEELLSQIVWAKAKKLGIEEETLELYESVKKQYSYSHLPIKLRHKRYAFDKDINRLEQIKQRVMMCREYIASIWPSFEQTITIHDQINGYSVTVHDSI